MLRWLHRSVNDNAVSRDEIARNVRAVRAACFGRKCLAKCVKRMTAAAPVRRRMRCAGAAAVAALLMFAGVARGDVVCTWQDGRYVCSGEGQSVLVSGGGGGGGDIVVTNIVGTCTNCVAMSPEYVRNWKQDAHTDIQNLEVYLNSISNQAHIIIRNLEPYTNNYPVSGLDFVPGKNQSTAPLQAAITNFLAGVDPSSPPVEVAEQIQGVSYYDVLDMSYNAAKFGSAWRQKWLSSYDAAAYAYNQFADNAALVSLRRAENIEGGCAQLQDGLDGLDAKVDLLSEEACTAQWDGGSGGGGSGGGGSTVVTNQVDGNWCTYDQGEAIKGLLDDIEEWGRKQVNYLDAISNRVVSIDATIKSALFTTYTHIPTEDELQTSWQELYLTGSNDNFPGYASTNIVARIELLLAGISGVLTNVSDYASQDEFADESLDSTNLVENAVGDFTNQFVNVLQGREASSRSVGDALVRLYQKFRTWSGTPFSTEFIINSYSVEFEDGKQMDVPGFSAPAKTLPWANVIRVICRSAMSVIWVLMTVSIFVKFQIVFFQWCFKYVKWGVEVLQGLFV